MKTAKYIELEDHYGAHNYHPLDIVIKKAEGGSEARAYPILSPI